MEWAFQEPDSCLSESSESFLQPCVTDYNSDWYNTRIWCDVRRWTVSRETRQTRFGRVNIHEIKLASVKEYHASALYPKIGVTFTSSFKRMQQITATPAFPVATSCYLGILQTHGDNFSNPHYFLSVYTGPGKRGYEARRLDSLWVRW